jgi:tripartite-type tricarboxylate transporter receptor subunit TctC
MLRRSFALGGIATCLSATFPAAMPTSAQAADFAGKTIEWIIPFGVGGGSDKWARFYAPWLGKALPGSPTVVVKNEPGGGSITATNRFASRAKPDGLTFIGTSGSTQFPYLLGDQRVKYEYKDWHIFLASATGGVVYISTTFGVNSARDIIKLKDKKLLYGSSGATSLDLVPILGFELIGLNVEPVFGIKSRGDARLGLERGELTIDYQTTSAYLSQVVPLVKEGKVVPLWSWGTLDAEGNLARDPTVPDLPHFGEVYEAITGKKPSGTAWNAWQAFFVAGFPGQKMAFLPKGTPDDIVEAYRAAMTKVFEEPDFKKTSVKALGIYPQFTGSAAEKTMVRAITIDKDDRDWVRAWLKRRFQVELK